MVELFQNDNFWWDRFPISIKGLNPHNRETGAENMAGCVDNSANSASRNDKRKRKNHSSFSIQSGLTSDDDDDDDGIQSDNRNKKKNLSSN